jgi:hypothetical protein
MNQTESERGGMVGQEQTPSQTPSVLAFPTIIPGLDLNFVWAISVIYTAGVLIFISFAITRIIRWISLRKLIPTKLDENGEAVLLRSTWRKILSWPGVRISKLALRSFQPKYIPSLGIILILVLWVGVTGLSSVWQVLPTLTFEALAYRLP